MKERKKEREREKGREGGRGKEDRYHIYVHSLEEINIKMLPSTSTDSIQSLSKYQYFSQNEKKNHERSLISKA